MKKVTLCIMILLLAFTVEATNIKAPPLDKPSMLMTGADTWNIGWWHGAPETLQAIGDKLTTKNAGLFVRAFRYDTQAWAAILWSGAAWVGDTTYELQVGDMLAFVGLTTANTMDLPWNQFPNALGLNWALGDAKLTGDLYLSGDKKVLLNYGGATQEAIKFDTTQDTITISDDVEIPVNAYYYLDADLDKGMRFNSTSGRYEFTTGGNEFYFDSPINTDGSVLIGNGSELYLDMESRIYFDHDDTDSRHLRYVDAESRFELSGADLYLTNEFILNGAEILFNSDNTAVITSSESTGDAFTMDVAYDTPAAQKHTIWSDVGGNLMFLFGNGNLDVSGNVKVNGAASDPGAASSVVYGDDEETQEGTTNDAYELHIKKLQDIVDPIADTNIQQHPIISMSEVVVGSVYNLLTDPVFLIAFTAQPGGTQQDFSGKGHTATYNGTWAATLQAVPEGLASCVKFDGVDDYLGMTDHDDFTFGDGANDTAVSVAAWIYVTAYTTAQHIISKIDANADNYEWALLIESEEKLRFNVQDDSAGAVCNITTNAAVALNEWIFVAATYDGTGGANAFDGGAAVLYYMRPSQSYTLSTIIPASTVAYTGTYTAMENTTAQPRVGARTGAGGPDNEFQGSMSMVIGPDKTEWSAAKVWSIYLTTKGYFH